MTQGGHANELNNFCKSTGCRTANGRIGSDKENGHFTCYKPNGNRIVDYLLIKDKDFDKLSNFEIGELNEYSDHCFLSLKIERNAPHSKENAIANQPNEKLGETQSSITDENLENLRLNYNQKFIYDNTSKDKIKESLNSVDITNHLNELDKDLDKITVPVAVSRLRKILLKIADKSMGKANFNKSQNPKKPKSIFQG